MDKQSIIILKWFIDMMSLVKHRPEWFSGHSRSANYHETQVHFGLIPSLPFFHLFEPLKIY